MRYVALGKTGVRISEVGFGCMTFGGSADNTESKALFAMARDAGINYFDNANVYNGGRSEELLGQFAKGCRDQLIISTKVYFPIGKGPNDRGLSRYHLRTSVEDSLRRLATDRIDILFLHRFDDRTPLVETLAAVDNLVTQGKVLYVGVSNFAAWQIARGLGHAEMRGFAPIAVVQPMYNLVKRQAEVEILPLCLSEGLAVVPYNPLAGGLLTGKYQNPQTDGRLTENAMYTTRYGDPTYAQAVTKLCTLANQAGVSPITIALRWLATRHGVTSPILGARNTKQLSECLAAFRGDISSEVLNQADNLIPHPPPATDRNEESSQTTYTAAVENNTKV